MKLGHVALDGTKVRANASKHKGDAELWTHAKESGNAVGGGGGGALLERVRAKWIEEEDRRYGPGPPWG